MDGNPSVRRGRRSSGAVVRIARVIAAAALVAAAVTVLTVFGLTLTGRIGVVITHGVSMQPHYYQGDLVVVARENSYQVGEIVAYRVPSRHLVVLHRLIGKTPAGYTFKGDNNQSVDPWHPTASQLVGHAVLHVPQGGLWLERIVNPVTVAIVVGLLLLAGTKSAVRRRKGRNARMAAHARRARPDISAFGSAPPAAWRYLTAATAVVAVPAIALAAAGWTVPRSAEATVTTAHQSRTMQFSYSAAVRRSVAYDGTLVHSPDPIFNKLADHVDLRFHYTGPAGILGVGAELSAASGWHTQLPLAVRTPSGGGPQVRTATLDLPALEARGKAATDATGMSAFPLTITLRPTVRSGGTAPFAPALQLSLTQLQLSVPGGAKALTVTDTVPVTAHVQRQQQLRLLGHGIAVSTARTVSLVALGLCALAALLLGLALRRVRPVDTVTAARRRYNARVLEVAPVASDSAIDVHGMDDLAGLANDLALPMLHWSADGADFFAVHDSTILYLHRAAPAASPDPVVIPRPTVGDSPEVSPVPAPRRRPMAGGRDPRRPLPVRTIPRDLAI